MRHFGGTTQRKRERFCGEPAIWMPRQTKGRWGWMNYYDANQVAWESEKERYEQEDENGNNIRINGDDAAADESAV